MKQAKNTKTLSKGEKELIALGFQEQKHNIDIEPGSFFPQDAPYIEFIKQIEKPIFNDWKETVTTVIHFDVWSKTVSATDYHKKEGEGKTYYNQFATHLSNKMLSAINQMFLDLKWK